MRFELEVRGGIDDDRPRVLPYEISPSCFLFRESVCVCVSMCVLLVNVCARVMFLQLTSNNHWL